MKFDAEKKERNAAVIKMYQETKNLALVARSFKISRERVKQIADKAGVRETKQPGSLGQYRSHSERKVASYPSSPHRL